MEKKIGFIYKEKNGLCYECVERGGELFLSNPSYPFVFTFEALGELEILGNKEEFGSSVEKENYEFHSGEELHVKVGKDGNLEVVEQP